MSNGENRVTEIDGRMGAPAPTQGLVQLTNVIYALHLFSAVTGLLGTAFVVTAFLTGWPSIIAVILNYIKRGDVRGTYLDSHFGWQIRTFWYALVWVVLGILLILTIIGLPFGWMVLFGAGIWVLYRIIRGWLALTSEKPMPV
jgi:uncharacterized membrane protein